MISGNPFIKKSGKRLWVSPLLLFQHEAVNVTSGVCIKQGGGRYHSTSTSLLKSETRLLKLMKIEMFSVLNLWFGHTCSMLAGFWVLNHIVSISNVLFALTTILLFFTFVARGGRFSDGWGSCERREKRFLKPNHDIPSTAETRAKNKSCQVYLFFLQLACAEICYWYSTTSCSYGCCIFTGLHRQ